MLAAQRKTTTAPTNINRAVSQISAAVLAKYARLLRACRPWLAATTRGTAPKARSVGAPPSASAKCAKMGLRETLSSRCSSRLVAR